MKKIILLFVIILSFSLTACNNVDNNIEKNKNTEIINEVIDKDNEKDNEDFKNENIENDKEEIPVLNKVIRPINLVNLNDYADKVIASRFNIKDFDLTQNVLFLDAFEKDVYKKEDIENMILNDIILVGGKQILVNSVKKEDDLILVNGGFTSSDDGMTFTINDEKTYKTILTDDYSTYTELGEAVYELSSDLTIDDYLCGDPDNKGMHYDINSLNEYINGLEEWAHSFNEKNTLIIIKNNKIVNIMRR